MSRTVLALVFLALTAPASAQSSLPLVDDVQPGLLREHCRRLLQALEALQAPLPTETTRQLQALIKEGTADAAVAEKIQKLLDPSCLAGVTINPESRVKAARGPAPAELRLDLPSIVLIKVHNDAGVTHGLTVSGPQLRSGKQAEEGQWLEATVQAGAPLGKTLSGQKLEYVVLRLTPREAGKREATLKFDVGQGTQDLGFRAEVSVLFLVKKEAGE